MLNLNESSLLGFRQYLMDRECSCATIEKYMRDMRALNAFCSGAVAEKAELLAFKEHLIARGYAVSSINSMLASVNSFLAYSGRTEWKMRFLKRQRALFLSGERQMTQKDYQQLVSAAKDRNDTRLTMLIQTICATGIRVSELRAITVESLKHGQAQLQSKGKLRLILMPAQLVKALRTYCKERNLRSGAIFVTKNGRPLDRSNIWKMMKRLSAAAGVKRDKVFPHNLRHLFACTYYSKYKDIVRLADILGHGSINTTRIYTAVAVGEQLRQLDKLCLFMVGITT